jgi:hypothetical protein
MIEKQLTVSMMAPTVDDFVVSYRNFTPLARDPKTQGLFAYLTSPEGYLDAVGATRLELPAVAGVAQRCFELARDADLPWDLKTRQFIGALVCTVMAANGYRKTGSKKAVPHPAFRIGEVYSLPTGEQ